MNFTTNEYKARLEKVKKLMHENGIELLISHDTANMNYLTGYDAWSDQKPARKNTHKPANARKGRTGYRG